MQQDSRRICPQCSRLLPAVVYDTGFSILFQPNSEPLADIIFVHGLQGHPKKTWTKELGLRQEPRSNRIQRKSPSRLHFWRRGKFAASDTQNTTTISHGESSDLEFLKLCHCERNHELFWPQDLLPVDRPDVRIMTWGYDTVVTRGWQPANKNNLFAHARDLLHALERTRPVQRPIVFVAHSLGGIIVKEVLRRSETSREPNFQDIIRSIVGTIFLGTPHRGNPGLADLGDVVRKTASTVLRVDSNAAILRVLGCDSPELELCRESFTSQWREYNFRVKTFQEALGLSGLNVSRFNEKVVPDTSSSLDDVREHAETVGANHMNMVSFFGSDDPGYQKVSGEISSIISQIGTREVTSRLSTTSNPPLLTTNALDQVNRSHSSSALAIHVRSQPFIPHEQIQRSQTLHMNHIPQLQHSRGTATGADHLDIPQPVNFISSTESSCKEKEEREVQTKEQLEIEEDALKSLSYIGLGARQTNISREYDGTGNWILDHPVLKEWQARSNLESHRGLLWLKGNPGVGKSVIMKMLFNVTKKQQLPGAIVAAFFFSARGSALEKVSEGMYRSLLHQILQQDEAMRRIFADLHDQRKRTLKSEIMSEEEYRDFLFEQLSQTCKRPTYLFIDGLDECEPSQIRDLALSLREVTDLAFRSGNNLSVCIASRRYPTITISRCPEIDVELGNRQDVSTYIRQKIVSYADSTIPTQFADLINNKASGVFLWAVLVVDRVLQGWDNGTPLHELEDIIEQTPARIEKIYDDQLRSLRDEERSSALKMFQCVLLTRDVVPLGVLNHLLTFAVPDPPRSFRDLYQSRGRYDEALFTRYVVNLSRNLLEVVEQKDQMPGAYMSGAFHVVQVIHESVYDWFVYDNGFRNLDSRPGSNILAEAHLQIMQTSMNILLTEDFLAIHPHQVSGCGRDCNPGPDASKNFWGSRHEIARSGPICNIQDIRDIVWTTTYCVHNIFDHAKRAEWAGGSPMALVHQLSSARSSLWLNLHRVSSRPMHFNCYTFEGNLTALLIEEGFDMNWVVQNIDGANFPDHYRQVGSSTGLASPFRR